MSILGNIFQGINLDWKSRCVTAKETAERLLLGDDEENLAVRGGTEVKAELVRKAEIHGTLSLTDQSST